MKKKKISRDVIISCAGGLLICLILIVIFISFKYFLDEIDKISVETVTLRSLPYQNVEKSNFVIGCSTIRGKNYYVFYRVCEDGGINLLQVNAAVTVIYEINADDTPYAVIEKNAWGKIRTVKLYVPENIIYENGNFGSWVNNDDQTFMER